MIVITGSQRLGLQPVEPADTSVSFTNVQAARPEDADEEVDLDMMAGDALLFHGKLIHGSYRNRTQDRWRRSFICHYVGRYANKFEPPFGKHVSPLKQK